MLYVRLATPKGYRYLYYTPTNYNYGVSSYDNPHYIHHGLGTSSNDGTWRTFARDLSADLKEFDADNNITSIDGFFVRASGLFDDISLFREAGDTPTTQDNVVDERDYTLIINNNTRLKTTKKGFELYDVSTPQTPKLLSSYDIFSYDISSSNSRYKRVWSRYLLSEDKQHLFIHSWFGSSDDGHRARHLPFQIVNISDLSNPIQKATTTLERDYYARVNAKWQHLGNNIYLISSEEELALYDLTNYKKIGSFAGRRIVQTRISSDKTKLYVLHAGTYRFWLGADTLSVLNLEDLSIIEEFPYAKIPGKLILGPAFTDFTLIENETKVKLTNKEGETKIIDLSLGVVDERDYSLIINNNTRLKTTKKGFELYDVSTPKTPELLSSYDISKTEARTCSRYLLSEDKLYLFIDAWQKEDECDSDQGSVTPLPLEIVNISDFSNPIQKATTTFERSYYPYNGYASGAKWQHLGNNIYLISSGVNFALYDLAHYKKVTSFSFDKSHNVLKTRISADKTKLYVLHADTLFVLNLTDLSIIKKYLDTTYFRLIENETKVKLTNKEGETRIIDLSSNVVDERDYTFIINNNTRLKSTEKGFELYDVSTPQIPKLLSSYNISEAVERVCRKYLLSEDKQHLFIDPWQKEDECNRYKQEITPLPLQIVNISDLSNPIQKATTTLERDYNYEADAKWQHLGNNIYLISSNGELALYDLAHYKKVTSFALDKRHIVKTGISADKTKLYILHADTYRFWLAADTLSVLNLTDLSIIKEYPDTTDFTLIENETKVKLTNKEGETKIIDLSS